MYANLQFSNLLKIYILQKKRKEGIRIAIIDYFQKFIPTFDRFNFYSMWCAKFQQLAFTENSETLEGKTLENPKPHKKYDEIFEIDVQYFDNIAIFTRKIKLDSSNKDIKISIKGQACFNTDGRCVMVEDTHNIKIKRN